jgi:hypothetical protein
MDHSHELKDGDGMAKDLSIVPDVDEEALEV